MDTKITKDMTLKAINMKVNLMKISSTRITLVQMNAKYLLKIHPKSTEQFKTKLKYLTSTAAYSLNSTNLRILRYKNNQRMTQKQNMPRMSLKMVQVSFNSLKKKGMKLTINISTKRN